MLGEHNTLQNLQIRKLFQKQENEMKSNKTKAASLKRWMKTKGAVWGDNEPKEQWGTMNQRSSVGDNEPKEQWGTMNQRTSVGDNEPKDQCGGQWTKGPVWGTMNQRTSVGDNEPKDQCGGQWTKRAKLNNPSI